MFPQRSAQVWPRRRRSSRTERSEKSWVTSGEVARALNMTDAAIRRWAREGLVDRSRRPADNIDFDAKPLSDLMKSRQLKGRARKAQRTARGNR